MNYYLSVLKKYAVFSGRARRKEFWYFRLFNLFFLIIAVILDNVFGTTIGTLSYGTISIVYALLLLIPTYAVDVRRLHDVDQSGWMLLIMFIPIIGWIWILELLCTEGRPSKNEYGSDPKEVVEDI